MSAVSAMSVSGGVASRIDRMLFLRMAREDLLDFVDDVTHDDDSCIF
jgi:hypothetical protein